MRFAPAALAMTLAGCAVPPPKPVQPAPPAGPVALSLPAPPPLNIPAPPRPPPDWCGAARLQWLVGRPTSDIPVPVYPGGRRVLCATCPDEGGYSATRLTILFDAPSGRVTAVRCG
ncbi:MAG TPA: hypothetical protein VGS12_04210 [Caulobacteraceae bacterium]|nr:hypothetical protein [Caulobacteraceae bacterium]